MRKKLDLKNSSKKFSYRKHKVSFLNHHHRAIHLFAPTTTLEHEDVTVTPFLRPP